MELTAASNLARALMAEHLDRSWRFEWDHARRRGGSTSWHPNRITMSRYLVPLWSEDQVRNTMLHEIAHALVGAEYGHGVTWQRTARMLGCDASRTHDNATAPAPWVLWCPSHGIVAKRYRRGRRELCCLPCYRAGRLVPVEWRRNDVTAQELDSLTYL